MKQLIVAPSARRDLQEIHDYIAKDNPDAASRLFDRLDKRFATLRSHPGIGRKRHEFRTGLRFVVEGNYVIAYRLADEDIIEVARVLHGKRNIRKILASNTD